jgi:uncharacterized protein (TIGR02271 family)
MATPPDDVESIRLVAEELQVTKERTVTGRFRVSTVTREHDVVVEEPLVHEDVEIERTPCDREIDAIPPIRREGDTIIVPVVEEQAIVQRRLVLKEELRIRRVRRTEAYQEQVTLRRQEAVIDRLSDDDNPTPPSSPQ